MRMPCIDRVACQDVSQPLPCTKDLLSTARLAGLVSTWEAVASRQQKQMEGQRGHDKECAGTKVLPVTSESFPFWPDLTTMQSEVRAANHKHQQITDFMLAC